MDGFSPNLNKKLHIGHLSNMVLAKAFRSLGVTEKTVSLLGDTLAGDIALKDALSDLNRYQMDFDFFPDCSLHASQMKYHGGLLTDGSGNYSGTKIFKIGDTKIVGVKSSGETSYFYQDVALAEMLKDKTLYITGNEQCNHFESLNKLFPDIVHIGLGLVKVTGKKMSSRTGNVILIEDFIEIINQMFNGDMKLIYNVFAGLILKSKPDADKRLNLDIISDPKNSQGLYISYTTARLLSAGCSVIKINNFNNKHLEFAYLKAAINLTPNTLFDALIQHCQRINYLYTSNYIKNNPENQIMFESMLSDLVLGCKKLGLFIIAKV